MDPAQKFVRYLKTKSDIEKFVKVVFPLVRKPFEPIDFVSVQPMTKPLENCYFHLEYNHGNDNEDSNNK